jgi:NurA domain
MVFSMLDFNALYPQIVAAGQKEQQRWEQRTKASDAALTLLQSFTEREWAGHIAHLLTAHTGFLFAHSKELPATCHPTPPCPTIYRACAVDGSQIAPDRNQSGGECYLLHRGMVQITYGTGERAQLWSEATLHLPEVPMDNEQSDDTKGINPAPNIGLYRLAYELGGLRTFLGNAPTLPTLALTDGSLILWQLYDEKGDDTAKATAHQALIETLKMGEKNGIPLCGYISGPGSRDIINTLRIVLGREKEKSVLGATDADLFSRLLSPGERSALFTTESQHAGKSPILKTYGATNQIAFFYLHTGQEIARVELPLWAAPHLDFIHASLLDQCNKGLGYPITLQESHEQAVVREADRQAFIRLYQKAMREANISITETRKARAKRLRPL